MDSHHRRIHHLLTMAHAELYEACGSTTGTARRGIADACEYLEEALLLLQGDENDIDELNFDD